MLDEKSLLPVTVKKDRQNDIYRVACERSLIDVCYQFVTIADTATVSAIPMNNSATNITINFFLRSFLVAIIR
jgi:hypothetical protein